MISRLASVGVKLPASAAAIRAFASFASWRRNRYVPATVTDVALWENLGAEGPGQFKAKVNVAGRVILGYSLTIRDLVLPTDVEKYGWWRIMLVLDSEANIGGSWLPRNTSLDGVVIPTVESEPLLYTPKIDTATQRVWLDIYVESASGGGGHAP